MQIPNPNQLIQAVPQARIVVTFEELALKSENYGCPQQGEKFRQLTSSTSSNSIVNACCGGEDDSTVWFESDYPVTVNLPEPLFYSEIGGSLRLEFEPAESLVAGTTIERCSSLDFCGWTFTYHAQLVKPKITSPLPVLVLFDGGPSAIEFDNTRIDSGLCAPFDPLQGDFFQSGCQDGISQLSVRYTNGSAVGWLQLGTGADGKLLSWSIATAQLPPGPTTLEVNLYLQNEYEYTTFSPFDVTILPSLSSLSIALACASYSFGGSGSIFPSETIPCNVTFSEPVVRSAFELRVEGLSLDLYDDAPTFGVDIQRVFKFFLQGRGEASGTSTVSVVAQNCDVLDSVNITSQTIEDATSTVTCGQAYIDIDEGASVRCTLFTANADTRVAVSYPFGFLSPDLPVAHYGTSWDFEDVSNGPLCNCRPVVDLVWWDDAYTCGNCIDTGNCGAGCNQAQVLFLHPPLVFFFSSFFLAAIPTSRSPPPSS